MTSNHDNNRQPPPGLLLPGLDGSNPLGFLAAMGLLRLLTLTSDGQATRRQPCLRWVISRAAWRPVITNAPSLDPASLITRLHHALEGIEHRQPFCRR